MEPVPPEQTRFVVAMITAGEFELYRNPEFIRAVEENLGRDPREIALDKKIPFARELASRIKFLQKAKEKIPSYYGSRCVIPPRAYEQSTSEGVSSGKNFSGKLCVDLTCGLGVDSFALSKNFEKVIAVERDPHLAEIARYNFGLLSARNIEVVNSTAEEFLSHKEGKIADMIYVDPDRRDSAGKRVAALENCSPNVRTLLPKLKEAAPVIAIKLSPLFDVHEAFIIFGDGMRVTVASERGECKEVLVETGSAFSGRTIAARITGHGEITFPYERALATKFAGNPGVATGKFLALPDVALTKGGIAARYYRGIGWHMTSPNGLAYGGKPVPGAGSRTYLIEEVVQYNPRKVKEMLKGKGIARLNIILRDFPSTTQQIAKQIGVREGGNRYGAVFTEYGNRFFVLLGDCLAGR